MPGQSTELLGRSLRRVSCHCPGTINSGSEKFGCVEAMSCNINAACLDARHNVIDMANVYADTRSETVIGKVSRANARLPSVQRG